jgi:hypothetical protein
MAMVLLPTALSRGSTRRARGKRGTVLGTIFKPSLFLSGSTEQQFKLLIGIYWFDSSRVPKENAYGSQL